MKYLLSFLKPYKIPITVAYVLTVAELMVEILLPFFLGKMINDGIVQQDLDTVIMWGSIMIGMALFALACGITNTFYASHTSFAFSYDLRKKLFDKIQAFSFADLNLYPTSGLVTRFSNDIRLLQNTLFMALRVIVKAPFIILGGVTMAFIVNFRLALVFLITVPLLVLFLLWVLKNAGNMFDHVQRYVDRVNQVMQENLSGMRLIKAFLRGRHEKNRFTKANSDLASMMQQSFRFIETTIPILMFVMNLALVFILWYGNKLAVTGETFVGDVVAIVNYALRIAMAISMLTFIILSISRAKASADRIEEVLQVKTDPPTSSTGSKTIKHGKITFDNVAFHYPSSLENALKDISFTINGGEKLAVIGATGSGKTSLFQLIPRLYDPTKGKIYIDDKPITAYDRNHLRKRIGYVPQTPLLFTGSVADNIAWGKNNPSQEEVEKAARDAQIHDTIMELDWQYDTKIGQKGVNLSGGQKQRISIARALIRDPKILMLDDSTSALDLTTESKLLDAIDSYQCTTLIITQKISTAMNADRILLLDYGEILAFGTHAELLEQSPLYEKIVESQFGKEKANASS